ncbi:XdhC family protein [Demequina aurantiaca]|uniref:XdhC family protein n=1 Tax=Demequina aurantiaca TaxID=676200 RepID=UPI003D32B3E0
MFDIAPALERELAAGRSLAVVMVARVDGSAPRALGSAMAVTDDGRAIGSISGGCVEGESYALAQEVISDGVARMSEFGFSDEDALLAGLSCGGHITAVAVRLTPADAWVREQLRAAARGDRAAMSVSLGATPGRIATAVGGGTSADLTRADDQSLTVVFQAPPRMVIVGAVDFSAALADASRMLGFHVTVVDARPVFATAERFASAHDVVCAWPDAYLAETEIDSRTVICVLTHEERFDVPVLAQALASPAAYVGAMGSRRTHDRRMALLQELGIGEDALARLRSPIGLDLGGSTAHETAIAIVAEVIADRTGASAARLSGTTGRIHGSAGARPVAKPVASAHQSLSAGVGRIVALSD